MEDDKKTDLEIEALKVMSGALSTIEAIEDRERILSYLQARYIYDAKRKRDAK